MGRLRSISRPIRRFAALDAERRALVVEAVACLLGARLTLVFVPFPRVARRLGTFVSPADSRVLDARSPGPDAHRRLAEQVGWAVTCAARSVPFRAVCLQQAMAARIMLGRRGVRSVLHFGATAGGRRPFDAHAWLDAGGVQVTGYPLAIQAVEIASFV
jgi:hypothetical protein